MANLARLCSPLATAHLVIVVTSLLISCSCDRSQALSPPVFEQIFRFSSLDKIAGALKIIQRGRIEVTLAQGSYDWPVGGVDGAPASFAVPANVKLSLVVAPNNEPLSVDITVPDFSDTATRTPLFDVAKGGTVNLDGIQFRVNSPTVARVRSGGVLTMSRSSLVGLGVSKDVAALHVSGTATIDGTTFLRFLLMVYPPPEEPEVFRPEIFADGSAKVNITSSTLSSSDVVAAGASTVLLTSCVFDTCSSACIRANDTATVTLVTFTAVVPTFLKLLIASGDAHVLMARSDVSDGRPFAIDNSDTITVLPAIGSPGDSAITLSENATLTWTSSSLSVLERHALSLTGRAAAVLDTVDVTVVQGLGVWALGDDSRLSATKCRFAAAFVPTLGVLSGNAVAELDESTLSTLASRLFNVSSGARLSFRGGSVTLSPRLVANEDDHAITMSDNSVGLFDGVTIESKVVLGSVAFARHLFFVCGRARLVVRSSSFANVAGTVHALDEAVVSLASVLISAWVIRHDNIDSYEGGQAVMMIDAGRGGALWLEGRASVGMTRSTLSNLPRTLMGGVAFVDDSSTLLFEESSVSVAGGHIGTGGAFYVRSEALVTVRSSSFAGLFTVTYYDGVYGTVGGAGGFAFVVGAASLAVSNVSIAGVKCATDGGVVYAADRASVSLIGIHARDIIVLGTGGVICARGGANVSVSSAICTTLFVSLEGGGVYAAGSAIVHAEKLSVSDVTIHRGALFSARESANVTAYDCAVDGVVSDDAMSVVVSAIYNYKYPEYVTISAINWNRGPLVGAAVFAAGNATLNMDALALSNVFSQHDGAGIGLTDSAAVFVTRGAFSSLTTMGSGGAFWAVGRSSLEVSSANANITGAVVGGGGCAYVGGAARAKFVGVSASGVSAGSTGGGVHVTESATVTMDSCMFINATSNGLGGAVFADATGLIVIFDSEFHSCRANTRGGVIAASGNSNVSVINTKLSARAGVSGGCVALDKTANVSLMLSTLESCVAGSGGAVFAAGASLSHIVGSTFSNCHAQVGGAVLASDASRVAVSNCTLLNTTATEDGGVGASSGSGAIHITDSVSTGSRANNGGFASAYGSSALEFTRLSVFDAASAALGGSLYAAESAQVIVSLCEFVSTRSGAAGGFLAQIGMSHVDINATSLRDAWSDVGAAGIFVRGHATLSLSGFHAVRVLRALKPGEGWLSCPPDALIIYSNVTCDDCAPHPPDRLDAQMWAFFPNIMPYFPLLRLAPVLYSHTTVDSVLDRLLSGKEIVQSFYPITAAFYTLVTSRPLIGQALSFTQSTLRLSGIVAIKDLFLTSMRECVIEQSGAASFRGFAENSVVEVRGYADLTDFTIRHSTLVVSGIGVVNCMGCKFERIGRRRAVVVQADMLSGSPLLLSGLGLTRITESSFASISTAGSGGVAQVSGDAFLTVERCDVTSLSASGDGGFVSVTDDVGSTASPRVSLRSITARDIASGGNGGFVACAGKAIVKMDDCTLSEVRADGGGGLAFVTDVGTLKVRNCTVVGVIAKGELGGGTFALFGASTVQVFDSVINGSTAIKFGGVGSVSPSRELPDSLPRVEFRNVNVHIAHSGLSGGAFHVRGGEVSISGCQFSNCSADASGGFVQTFGDRPSSVVVFGCSFAHITAGISGGLINLNDDSMITLDQSRAVHVSAQQDGGLVAVSGGQMSVVSCDVEGSATLLGSGGCFAVESGTLSVSTSTFRSSVAALGGGFIALEAQGRATLLSVDVEGASATILGGGALSLTGLSIVAAANLTLRNVFAAGSGGGLLVDGLSELNLADAVVSDAASQFGWGGAVSVTGRGILNMTRVSIIRATAQGSGGAIASQNGARVLLDHVEVASSVAIAGDGGALACADRADVVANNLAIMDSSARAGSGGAIHTEGDAVLFATGGSIKASSSVMGGALSVVDAAAVALVRVNVYDSTSVSHGGCVYALSAMLTVSNSVFERCSAGNSTSLYSTGGVFYFGAADTAQTSIMHVRVTDAFASTGPVIFSTSLYNASVGIFAADPQYVTRFADGNNFFSSPPANLRFTVSGGASELSFAALEPGAFMPSFSVVMEDVYGQRAFAVPSSPLGIRLASNCSISGDLSRTFLLSSIVNYTSIRVSSSTLPTICRLYFESGNLLHDSEDPLFATADTFVQLTTCGPQSTLQAGQDNVLTCTAMSSSSSVSTTAIAVAFSVCGFCVLLLLLGFMYVRRVRRHWEEQQIEEFAKHMEKSTPDMVKYEIPRGTVELQEILGEGNFGVVYRAQVSIGHKLRICAAKSLKPGTSVDQRIEFIGEAQIMMGLSHPNVTSLVGVSTTEDPMLIIIEYLAHGSLKSFLSRLDRHRQATSSMEAIDLTLVGLASGIAAGMQYLAQNRIVHKDLSARNVLVGQDTFGDFVAKIADFGLSRSTGDKDYYRKKGRGVIPVKWSAPESALKSYWSTHSDVWSYGVVLWELWTLGQNPYPGVTNRDVIPHILSGNRLERPSFCPLGVYGIMMKCWHIEPSDRPTFSDLFALMERLRAELENVHTHRLPAKNAHEKESPYDNSNLHYDNVVTNDYNSGGFIGDNAYDNSVVVFPRAEGRCVSIDENRTLGEIALSVPVETGV